MGSGVRRIEACTGQVALEWTQSHEKLFHDVLETLQVAPDNAKPRIETLLADHRALEKKYSDLQRQLAVAGGAYDQEPEKIGNVSFISRLLEGVPGRDLGHRR